MCIIRTLCLWKVPKTSFFQSSIISRSGTEEEYSELMQLLQDILTYNRDMQEQKEREKELKSRKEREDRQKALEMREAAVSTLRSKQVSY